MEKARFSAAFPAARKSLLTWIRRYPELQIHR